MGQNGLPSVVRQLLAEVWEILKLIHNWYYIEGRLRLNDG